MQNPTVIDLNERRSALVSSIEEQRQAVWLWNMLEAEYPGRWMAKAGEPIKGERLSVIAKRWVSALSPFAAADVQKGLEYVTRYRAEAQFLPSLGELVVACREFRRTRLAREDMLARETRLPRKGTVMPASLSELVRGL